MASGGPDGGGNAGGEAPERSIPGRQDSQEQNPIRTSFDFQEFTSPLDSAFEALLPQVPDPGGIDSYLHEWMSYEEPPFLQSLPGQPLEDFGLSQAALEDAARQLSLDPSLAQYQAPVRSVFQGSSGQASGSAPLEDPAREQSPSGAEGAQGRRPLRSMPSSGFTQSTASTSPSPAAESSQPARRYGLRSRRTPAVVEPSPSESDEEPISESSESSGRKQKRLKRAKSGVAGAVANTIGRTVGSAVKGGVAAIGSVLPKKRSRDPEIIKEKEKARNRRAQKAFRERQKMLQDERYASMKRLEDTLKVLGAENNELKGQVKELQEVHERDIGVREEKVAPFSVPQATAPEEPEEPISEPITISADPTNVRQIPLEDMNRLRIEDLCTIWREYLEAMSSILGGGPGQVDVDPNEVLAAGDKERVVLMVRELARLSQVIAHYQSSMFLKFQNTNLESLAEEKAPRLHWRSVLAMMDIDMEFNDERKQGILKFRRDALNKLAQLLDHRNRLLSIQVQMLAAIKENKDVHTKDIAMAHQSAFDAVEELMENLKAEQAMIVREMCTLQQSLLSTVQLGRFICYSWPYYPGKMECASVLAQLAGEPSTSLLLDISQPTSARTLLTQAI